MIEIKNEDRADYYINRVKNLPPAPAVAINLLALFRDPNRNIDRIVELIRHDPSLTAAILKQSNSASFGSAAPISSIFEAVTRLGFYETYCVAAAVVGANAMSIAKGGLNAGMLWRHSVVAAVAAGTLASHVQDADGIAFAAGLLHDIGKLVFASVERSRYALIVTQIGAFGPALGDAEQFAFGVTHACLGARLLARWGLPECIVVAVRHHHGTPSEAGPYEHLAAIVQLANNLAHHLSDQSAGPLDLLSLGPDAVTELELEADDLPKLTEQIQSGLERVQGILNTVV